MSRIQIPPNSFDACKVSGRACYTHAQPCMYSMSWRNPWCIDRDIFEKVYLSDGTNQIIPKKSPAGSPANPVCAQRRFAPWSAVRFVRPATCSLKHIWAIIHVHSKLRGWRNFHFWKLQFNARHDPVRRLLIEIRLERKVPWPRWRWAKRWIVRPVFGLSETDLYWKCWINLGIQHVWDVNCVGNCWMRNAFIVREKCTAEMTFIGKNFFLYYSRLSNKRTYVRKGILTNSCTIGVQSKFSTMYFY